MSQCPQKPDIKTQSSNSPDEGNSGVNGSSSSARDGGVVPAEAGQSSSGSPGQTDGDQKSRMRDLKLKKDPEDEDVLVEMSQRLQTTPRDLRIPIEDVGSGGW